ncbi:MAG: endopeptidase La [Bacilli bacterium]|nr:endopeptidase La [Bacilli bacterium]
MVETNLPVILLKNNILFPYNEIRVEFTRAKDKIVLENSLKYHDSHVLLVNLDDPLEENPNIGDLPGIGVIGKIKSKIELANGVVRTVIAGLERVEVLNYLENDYETLEAFVVPVRNHDYDELEANALKRVLFKDLNEYINTSSLMGNSVLGRITGVDSISKITDIVCSELPVDYDKKFKYLMTTNPLSRIKLVIKDLNREIETVNLENEIELTLKEKIDASQREYLLREKIRIIKEELGESTIKDTETASLKRRISEKNLPIRVRKRVQEELKRYVLSSEASPEVTIIRTYIDWILNLPWLESSTHRYRTKQVQEILDESHYGLDEVKRRIVEFVVVSEKIRNSAGTIICLVGPPGVGKTTLAKSVAKALNKKFVKVSVGGISDEGEIIGHRRTYLGANPGKIIQGMKKVGVNNPVFLIDEIDKLSKDYHGDPASALLEVLDKEQNSHFCDNYIEEEFDLSNVFFILTANDITKIPNALKDRLEIIELSSYTNYDKREICKKYLIPKLFKDYKIRNNNINIDEKAIVKIIEQYTKEAGARELTRKIEQICRKVVYENLRDIEITPNNLKEFLGSVKYYHQKNDTSNQSGIVNALAYTIYGGEILKVSATSYEGSGKIKVTGSVGKIMEESVEVALSFIKSNAQKFGIDAFLFQFKDFHVHIEEGASPKDGPSAGITIATAILSLLKNKVIANDISMTGEMTLRGKILPIGGLKEKLIAASANDIKQVFIPIENKIDLEEVPTEVKKKLDIVLVRDYLDVYYYLFNEEMKEEKEQSE